MNANSAEAAALRTQIASLRSSLACFVAATEQTIAELQKTVDRLEPPNAPRTTIFAPSPSAAIVPRLKPKINASPVFPNEIFLQIGKLLRPGSRTLFRLLSTSKSLYVLLVPRFLECLDNGILLDNRFEPYRRERRHLLQMFLKELDLRPVKLATVAGDTPALVNGVEEILRVCSGNLRRVSVDMRGSVNFACFPYTSFPSLEELRFVSAPESLPKYLAERGFIGNVRKLTIRQDLEAEPTFSIGFWKGIANLKALEEVSLAIAPHHEELAQYPELVAKIKEYEISCFESFRQLVKVPGFRPSYIDIDYLNWPTFRPESKELWGILMQMDQLTYFSATHSFDLRLLFDMGFPPNLEHMYLDHALPMEIETWASDTHWEERCAAALARRPPSLKDVQIDFLVLSCPERDSLEWYSLVDEIKYWCEFNSVDCGGYIADATEFDDEDEFRKEEAARVADLSDDVHENPRRSESQICT